MIKLNLQGFLTKGKFVQREHYTTEKGQTRAFEAFEHIQTMFSKHREHTYLMEVGLSTEGRKQSLVSLYVPCAITPRDFFKFVKSTIIRALD